MQAHALDIAKRYAAGESMQTLAAEHKVHRATLYRWLLAAQGDKDYADLVTHCLVQRVAESDGMLESASDPCDIARAREMAKFARMDLERRRPALYGAKQEQLTLQIGVQIVAFSPQNEGMMRNGALCQTPSVAQQQHAPVVIEHATLATPQPIAADPARSPVAPRLVDSGGDQSASIASVGFFSGSGK